MSVKKDRAISILKETIAKFLNSHSTGHSLITVTDCTLSDDLKKVTAYISVFPDKDEESALNFAKRKRTEIRDYIKENTQMRTIPYVEIELDLGEKARQKMDETFRQIENEDR